MRNLYSDTLLRSLLHFDGIPFFYIQKFRRLFTDNYSITVSEYDSFVFLS